MNYMQGFEALGLVLVCIGLFVALLALPLTTIEMEPSKERLVARIILGLLFALVVFLFGTLGR